MQIQPRSRGALINPFSKCIPTSGMQGARPPGTPHRTEYDPTSPRAIRSLAESSYCRGEKISDYLLHRFCSQKDPNFAIWQLVDAPCFRKNNKDTANDPKSENFSILAIGPFHIRKRMCVIYEYAIIEFDVTFGFHRGSQKSSKCIGVNGGTPYF